VTSTGAAAQRINTPGSAEFVLQAGPTGAANHSWGWTDNGWGAPGEPVYFETSGTHTLRMQQREDGAIVDQIVLSPSTYFTNAPGPHKDDKTILAEANTTPPPPPPPTCTFTLSSTGASYGADGAADRLTVTASDRSCTWSASSSATWLAITGGSAVTGSGDVTFRVEANSGAARTATITAAGATFTATQAAGVASPPACTFTLAPASANHPSGGGAGSFTVTASDPSCAWSATSTVAGWLSVDAASASGTGSGSVSYTVQANTGAARSGGIDVGGRSFAVTQDAAPASPPADACGTVTLDSTSKNVGATEANWVITVTAPDTTCTWTATSDAPDWLVVRITTPTAAPVAGSGTIKVRAVANTTGLVRLGHFIVNGVTYTVKQSGS
jgi:hypothetical protein